MATAKQLLKSRIVLRKWKKEFACVVLMRVLNKNLKGGMDEKT